ncbi:group I truncated hemoglobin [Dyadobacter pollutisoli]|jgi:hemoglobin|uniref:Group 1 truncated hemoglobin n=1 Tax=Dyadobacter pollutisoli TaxID=2910158 RepID=A0A9E8NDS4_9BACT|nr:group 1 truncated hemoglobin [Dyadobacter pollutisoli]WAC13132.1 group 1 truncated hemoglobin [Dyadobacter pollutisoli]
MTTILYERLGGADGITAIVEAVVEAHMSNPSISGRFLPYREQPEKLAGIKKHTVDFFSAGSGAAVAYTGRDMVSTHTGMHITAAEYMYVVDDILAVLTKRQIDDVSKNEVLAILWSLKGLIIDK